MPRTNPPKTPAASSTVAINGYALRWGRKLMNLTPAAVAQLVGCDRTYIVKIETGAVQRVSTDLLDRLVAGLHIEDKRALQAAPHVVAEDAA